MIIAKNIIKEFNGKEIIIVLFVYFFKVGIFWEVESFVWLKLNLAKGKR